MALITEIKDKIIQLNQADFQILCDAYLYKEGYTNIVSLGTMAGRAKTTPGTPDTYFTDENDKYVFAEYTTQTNRLVSKINDDIDKCLDESYTGVSHKDISEIVYCHTSSNINPKEDYKLRDKCSSCGIKLTLIGIDKLANDLFIKYHYIVKDILHLTIDTEQIQTLDEFVDNYDLKYLSAPLNTEFNYREDELNNIKKYLEENDAVILKGAAGVGKTRLAIEYVKKYSNDYKCYFISNRSLPIMEDVRTYFNEDQNYLIVIDDANQLSELNQMIDYLHNRKLKYNIKFLITVRNYALEKVKKDIIGLINFKQLELGVFKDDEIKSLISKHFSISNHDCLERIVEISKGNARIAMIAGKTAVESDSLESIGNVTELYDAYYGKAFINADLDNVTQKVAGIVAFWHNINLEYIDDILLLANANGINEYMFIESIKKLHDNEFLDIYHDKAVLFSDQCFENFILKHVFYDNKLLSLSECIECCFDSNQSRTVQTLNTIMSLFKTEEVINFVKTEIIKVWKSKEKGSDDRFWKYVKCFYHVKPEETLILLKNKIDALPSCSVDIKNIKTNSFDYSIEYNEDIVRILSGFSDTKDIDSALDILFEYYLKNSGAFYKFFECLTNCFGIKGISIKNSFYTQLKVINKFIEYSNNWDNNYISLMFVKVAENYLQFHFNWLEAGGRDSFYACNLFLPSCDKCTEYRKIIWEQLILISNKGKYKNEISNILQHYASMFDECNHKLIESDKSYLLKILYNIFDSNDIKGDIIAEHLSYVFKSANLPYEELNEYLNSENMRLYHLIKGPQWNLKDDYDENEKMRDVSISQFIFNSKNKFEIFCNILNIFSNIKNSDLNSYRLNKGIIYALSCLDFDKELYLKSFQEILNHKLLIDFNVDDILNVLFKYMTTDEVYRFISNVSSPERNILQYNFFYKLPVEEINKKWTDELYIFFKDDSDRLLESIPYRDIIFINKFNKYNKNIFIDISKIIFDKLSYSKSIVNSYFSFIGCRSIPAEEIVELFNEDIILLEKIYLFEFKYEKFFDMDGKLLRQLYLKNKSFLNEYIFSNFKQGERFDDEYFKKLNIFWDEENYINIFDDMIISFIGKFNLPSFLIADLIKIFITYKDEEKVNSWINHFIEKNFDDRNRMNPLFGAINYLDIQHRVFYFKIYFKYNADFDSFRELPLIPNISSWSGSAVPMLLSRIDFLEKLLPMLNGIKFINHKKLIVDSIDRTKRQIEEEEIRNILRE